MLDSVALQQILISGTLLSLLLGIIVLGSLKYNARLWLQDYPKAIRDKVPPLSVVEKRERAVLAVVVIGILFGGVILETLHLRTYPAGVISFGTAYLHIFLILAMFNLFDALVLDLFIITLLKPRFVILPGAEGMEYLFHDYRKHVTDFLKGIAFCTVASLPIAVIAVL
jgi:uncharacterized membrane protein